MKTKYPLNLLLIPIKSHFINWHFYASGQLFDNKSMFKTDIRPIIYYCLWFSIAYLFIYLGFTSLSTLNRPISTGSWKGRGNQYIWLVKVLSYKLLTNSKQLPAFPLEVSLLFIWSFTSLSTLYRSYHDG